MKGLYVSADIFAKQKTKSMLIEIPVTKDWIDSCCKMRSGFKAIVFLLALKISIIGMLNIIPKIIAKIDSE